MSEEMITSQNPPETRAYSRYTKLGIFFTTLGIVILVTAYGYGYFQLARVNMTLANMIEQLEVASTKQADTIRDLQSSLTQSQETGATSISRLDSHEKLLAELNAGKKGDMNHWQVSEVEYLVKLANERILYSENNRTALPLLERALMMLQSVNDPHVASIRDALATDINNLKAQATIDVAKLYAQITALDPDIDQLEMPFAPLSTDSNSNTYENDPEMPWWKKGLKHSADVLKQVVIIKRNESNSLPIVMPDEKTYLYQNLHAQVETMIWALLHQQQDIYQACILRMQQWLNTYFVQKSPVTVKVAAQLKELQAVNLSSQKMDLSPTLNLFEQYLMATHSENVAQ